MNPKSIKIYWLNAIYIQPQAHVIRIFQYEKQYSKQKIFNFHIEFRVV